MRTRRCYRWRTRRSQRRLRWLLFILAAAAWWAATAQRPVWLRFIGMAGAAWLLLKARDELRIPVLTYHSVSARGQWLREPGLVVTTTSFEAQLKWLQKHGYRTLNMEELIHFRSQGTNCGKSVALTFDDGYLDAWVAVAPLLERYGCKGTVFVSSGWIEDGDAVRLQMDHADEQDLQWEGYLNRAEVCLLKQKGILDVQSHGLSHDRVFTGRRIDDFVIQNPPPLWVYLLHHPEDRIHWYQKSRQFPKGRPIFKAGEALAAAAFHPDPENYRRFEALAQKNGHLPNHELHLLLSRQAAQWMADGRITGRREDPEQTLVRWKDELQSSKEVLEEITGRCIDHFCWPRSAWQPQGEALALELGYRSTTNGDRHNGPDKPWRVSRVHMGGIGRPVIDLWRFVLEIQVFRGHYWLWPLLWLIQKAMARRWRIRKRRLL
jgi:peptidoglycan/xylan/chitin deacetylase (PgdA/CDA1 family)